MSKLFLLIAAGPLAFAQQYTISTVAGGAPPPTPVNATSTSIGLPRRVTADKAGNIYFSAGNSVFEITTGGVLMLVAGNSRPGFSGDGGPAINAQLDTPQGLAVDSSGNLYIADSRNNRIRIVSGGIINTFAGNGGISQGGGPGNYNDGGPATNALMHLPQGVAVDSSGNVYIADTGDNIIRKVTTDGNITTIVGDSYPGFLGDTTAASGAELHTPSDVAVDSSGNIYIADSANEAIRKVTTDGNINSIAGNQTVGYSGDDGLATSAGLYSPISVAVDSSGNVYLAEYGDSRIRKIDTKGNISTVAGTNSVGFAGDNSSANHTPLNSPTGVAVDGSGNFYIADSLNLRVRKVTSSLSISTIAGNGVMSYSGDGGAAIAAQLNAPQGVAADTSGNFYISDTGNNVVRKVSAKGIISTLAGNGTAGSGGDGSAATSAQLYNPTGLAVDGSGNVYISDSLNAKVRKVTPGGTISTVAGNGTPGFGGDGAGATSAQLNTPSGLAVDGSGNLYIADFGNNRVRKVTPGGTITTVAGTGNSGYAGDGGQATSALLTTPASVAVDGSGNLYIADTGNNVVREVSSTGIIRTIAGIGYTGYSGDGGPATSAQLSSPMAIAVDSVGNLFIADGGTAVRQVVYPTGVINTIAGGSRGYSGDGGMATNAQLSSPSALALDASGNLLVADTGNNAIRLLQPSSGTITLQSVVNGASLASGPISPGEVIVIFGSGLGPANGVSYQLGANGFVPTVVGGTSLQINGALAPILYASATQITAVVPFGVTGSSAQITAIYQGQSSNTATVNVAAVTPAIFTANSTGSGQAAAFNPGGAARIMNDAGHPANAGDVVSVYATGLGQTNPPAADGQIGGDGQTSAILQAAVPVTATVGGKQATVQLAAVIPGQAAGVMEVNITIPAGLPAGAAALQIQAGGATSQSGVTLSVSGQVANSLGQPEVKRLELELRGSPR